MQPITYNAGRPVSVTLRLPSDRNNGIKRDIGIFLQDRWAMGRVTLNLGLRYDQFIGETRESEVLPSRFSAGATFGECADGTVDPGDLLHRQGAELEGHLAARRLRDGRVRQRPHRDQGELRALRRRPGDCVRQPGEPDRRADRDRHARRGPTSTATACRSTPTATSSSTSSTNSASTPTFGRLTSRRRSTRPTCCTAGASAATTTSTRSRCSTSSPIASR